MTTQKIIFDNKCIDYSDKKQYTELQGGITVTNQERLQELMQKNQIDTISSLLRNVARYISPDCNAYEWAEKNKGNFSKMIKGERSLPFEWVVALEKTLHAPILSIFDDVKSKDFKMPYENITLKYAAYVDEIETYVALSKLTTKSGESIISNSDEFNKMLLDYIIAYNSINGLRFLRDNYNLHFTSFNNMFNVGKSILSCSDYENSPYLVARLICEADDEKLFNDIFNPFQLNCYYYDEDRSVFAQAKFLESLLRTEKIFSFLLTKQLASLQEVNRRTSLSMEQERQGLFANPLVNYILEECVKLGNIEKLKRLLSFAITFNEEQQRFLFETWGDKVKGVKVNEEGYVLDGFIKLGNIIKYSKPVDPTLPIEIKNLLVKLQQQQVDFLDLRNLFSNNKSYIKGNIVIKTSSNNQVEYEMLKHLENKEFEKVPRYLGSEEGVDRFSYIQGGVPKYRNHVSGETIADIIDFLRELHCLSQKILEEGKVYVHSNLSAEHLVLDKDNRLMGIIDWEHCHIGTIYEDLIDVILEWTDIESFCRNNEKVLAQIVNFVTYYNSAKMPNNLGNLMKAQIQEKIAKLDKNASNYEYMYEAMRHAESFVDLYMVKLNNMQKEN